MTNEITIEGAVTQVTGVTSATVDIEAKTVAVVADGAERDAIVAAIEDQGYVVDA